VSLWSPTVREDNRRPPRRLRHVGGSGGLHPSGSPEVSHREPVCASDPRRGNATGLTTGELCTFLRAVPASRVEGCGKTWMEFRGRPVRLRLASFPANALLRQSEDARTAVWL
jgi:hypothetical protein